MMTTDRVKMIASALLTYASQHQKGIPSASVSPEEYFIQAIESLLNEHESLKKERDEWKARCEAAERDIEHCCETCQYHHVYFDGYLSANDCTNLDGECLNNYDRWNWRGPCAENGGAE